jgi:formate dehydrogenase subunit gamma
MSTNAANVTQTTAAAKSAKARVVRHFLRFTLSQRAEHLVIMIACIVLLLTGLPQKYNMSSWSQPFIETPARLSILQTIHHIFAVILIIECLYHVGRAIYLLTRRKLSPAIFPTTQDLADAWQMVKYLLFLAPEKPRFGRYNYEQKFMYWLVFFALGVLTFSGLIIWFPILVTRVLPGGIVPAAKLAHSTEAIVTAIFLLIWHTYHVHIERFNTSIFTGYISEDDLRTYHPKEYERLVRSGASSPKSKNQAAKGGR